MDLEIKPINALDELLKWMPEKASGRPASVELHMKNAWTENLNQPRTLLCHDMRGGYLADRFTNGCRVDFEEPYLFYHWSHIHGFIYFSHNFVTIPPTGWINAAHRNNVPVLGTLITEWDDGKAIWDRLTSEPGLLKQTALQLVEIAEHYGFDGWLINIENSIKPDNIGQVLDFLRWLRQASTLSAGKKGRAPLSVIWYDSITVKGDLVWQNSLNEQNMPFFQFVDGIFLNYNWKLKDLAMAKKTAGPFRRYDVFVGVDVFGRGCLGGGGWNTAAALEVIRQHDMSVAMFAPGWVLECNESADFLANQNRFWSSISSLLPQHKISRLPIETSFCTGFGRKKFCGGNEENFNFSCLPAVEQNGRRPASSSCWYDLNQHSMQPSWATRETAISSDGMMTQMMRLCHDDGFSGGGCLQVAGYGSPTWELFKTDIPLPQSPLAVALTMKFAKPSLEEHSEWNLVLKLRRGLSLRVIHLVCDDMRSSTTSPETEVSLLRIDPRETVMTKPDSRGLSWKSFRFVINDIATHGFTLEQVDLSFTKGTKTDSPVFALLGKLNIGSSAGN